MSDFERVTAEDLEWAATWLKAYNDGEDTVNGEPEPMVPVARRVAAYLLREAERRNEDAAVRKVVATTGASPARARAALRRHMAAAASSSTATAEEA